MNRAKQIISVLCGENRPGLGVKCHKYSITHWLCISSRNSSLQVRVPHREEIKHGSSTSVDLSDYSEDICYTTVSSSLYINMCLYTSRSGRLLPD